MKGLKKNGCLTIETKTGFRGRKIQELMPKGMASKNAEFRSYLDLNKIDFIDDKTGMVKPPSAR